MKKMMMVCLAIMISVSASFAETQKTDPRGTAINAAMAVLAASITPAAGSIPAAVTISASAVTITASGLTNTAFYNPSNDLGLTSTAAAITNTASGLTITAAVNTTITADAKASTLPVVADLSPAVINFATSAKDGITLTWSPKQKDNVYYNVFRLKTADYEMINAKALTATAFTDSDILSATVYYYKIEASDTSKNAYMSKTQSVKSADFMPPNTPGDVKAFQDVQSVSIKWVQSGQGTYPVSGYNFYRGKKPDELAFVKFVPFSKTYFTDDNVEPGARYYYKMSGIDIKNYESKMSPVVSAVPFPRQKTNICLLPSAYRNNIYDNMGLNVDMGFTYYIGTIFEEYNVDKIKKSDTFVKTGVWLLSVDVKWTFLNDLAGWWPSLGVGALYSMLLQDSIGSSTQSAATGGSATLSTKDKVLGQQAVYITAAKNAFLDTTMYAGYLQGFKFSKEDKGKGAAGYITYIVNSIFGGVNDSVQASDTNLEVRNAYYFGLSRDIVQKIGIKLELTVPLELNKNPLLPVTYIINTHIDRLFNFDIAYVHFDGGYAWVGYYNLRFSIYPSPYK